MKEEEIRKREVFNKYLELSAKDVEVFFKDKSRFSRIDCPACGSRELDKALEKNGFSYYSCRKCDTLFVNPRPPLDMFEAFYANSPSTTFWVKEFFTPVAEARREKIFKPRAEFISKMLDGKRNLAIGDIGAGFGLFLEELGKIRDGDKLVAIEPSAEMADICRGKGLQVANKLLETVDPREYQFDVLTSFELFEHLYNPEEFLSRAFNLLKPSGIFVFTTLSGLGFDIQVLWERSKSVTPPHHLNFFNPWSIRTLLKKTGFQVVEVSTPGALDWDIVEGGFTHEGVSPGRFFETVSKYGTHDAKASLQSWISDNGLSSHMRVVVKK